MFRRRKILGGYINMDMLYEVEGSKLFWNAEIDYKKLIDPSCATPSQIGYLMQLIKAHRFKNGDYVRNVAEVGVCTGMSSLFMLRAGKDRDDFKLYGIEKGEGDFYGHIAYEHASEEEKSKWKFFTGCTTYDIEKILGGGVVRNWM
jgi:hypothetical protein